jgi:hypothetical protein
LNIPDPSAEKTFLSKQPVKNKNNLEKVQYLFFLFTLFFYKILWFWIKWIKNKFWYFLQFPRYAKEYNNLLRMLMKVSWIIKTTRKSYWTFKRRDNDERCFISSLFRVQNSMDCTTYVRLMKYICRKWFRRALIF